MHLRYAESERRRESETSSRKLSGREGKSDSRVLVGATSTLVPKKSSSTPAGMPGPLTSMGMRSECEYSRNLLDGSLCCPSCAGKNATISVRRGKPGAAGLMVLAAWALIPANPLQESNAAQRAATRSRHSTRRSTHIVAVVARHQYICVVGHAQVLDGLYKLRIRVVDREQGLTPLSRQFINSCRVGRVKGGLSRH